MPTRIDVKLSPDEIALLHEKVIAHVATVGPDGSPHVTPVWVDTDGEALLFNSVKRRVKHLNLSRDPRVAVSVTDRSNDYRRVVIRGRAELIEEGADAHIDRLAMKYLGQDRYPLRQPGEERVTVRVIPERIHRLSQ
jgi:PPOX class probable F420-dependent enzyme